MAQTKNKFKEINQYIENIDSFDTYSIGSKDDKANQLFTTEPPYEFVNEIIYDITNKNLSEDIYYEFTIKNLVNKKSLLKVQDKIEELKKYYLKCKHSKYLENITEKKLITILRQILRQFNYAINSVEKYNNGEKFLLYILEKKKVYGIKKISSLINFD